MEINLIRYNANRSGKLRIGNAIISEQSKRDYGHKFNLNVLRLREIEKIIKSRHGIIIPETDDADLYIEAAILSLSGQDMMHWCRRWAPWAIVRFDEIVAPILSRHAKRRYMQSANACAAMLHIKLSERDALELHTIGACDVSEAERHAIAADRKKERDRTRQEQKRKAAGMKDRQSYEAESLSQRKPWEAEGISRAKWYRQKRETSLSLVVSTDRIGDTPVSTVQKATQAVPPRPFTDIKEDIAEAVRAVGEHRPSGPPLGVASGSIVPPAPRLEIELKKAG